MWDRGTATGWRGTKGGAKGVTMSVEDVFDVSGVAVITGGAGGFGLEIGQRCAAAGMRVALLDVVEDKLRAAADSCAGDATIPVVCDVTDPKSCAAALEAVEQQYHTPSEHNKYSFDNSL